MAEPMWKIRIAETGGRPPHLPSCKPHVRPGARKIESIKTLEIRPLSGRRTARLTATATTPAHGSAAAVVSFRVNDQCINKPIRAGFLLRYGAADEVPIRCSMIPEPRVLSFANSANSIPAKSTPLGCCNGFPRHPKHGTGRADRMFRPHQFSPL
jgi:hypothetical protein